MNLVGSNLNSLTTLLRYGIVMLNENGKLFYKLFGRNLLCDKTIFPVLVTIFVNFNYVIKCSITVCMQVEKQILN